MRAEAEVVAADEYPCGPTAAATTRWYAPITLPPAARRDGDLE